MARVSRKGDSIHLIVRILTEPLIVRRRVFKVALLVASVLVGLVLSELALRVSGLWVGRHTDTMFAVMDYDARFGWKMKPSVHENVSFVDVENIPVRANSLGFWDEEFKLAKDPQKQRVEFLGDSFTWGMGVKEQERFSNQLSAIEPRFESLNFGMPGFGTDQELLLWQSLAKDYRPEVVVLTVYQNDYSDNTFVIRSGRRKPFFEWKEGSPHTLKALDSNASDFWRDGIYNEAAPPYESLYARPVERRSRVMHWLVKYSDLARLGYTLMRRANETGEPTVVAQVESPRKTTNAITDLPRTQQVEVGLMDVLLQQFASEVKGSGAKFVVILAGNPNMNFDVQKQKLHDAGIAFIDATTDVLSTKMPPGTNPYFPYNKHWTREAHRAVAEMLKDVLVQQPPETKSDLSNPNRPRIR